MIAALSIALAAALLALAAAAAECRRRRRAREADAATAESAVALGHRLAEQLEHARQREFRASQIVDDRRAEACELRAELERRGGEAFVGHRVVIQTKDGHTLDGMMAEVYADHYRIEAGKYLVGGKATVLSGDELVPIDNVSWMQRPSEVRDGSEGA